MIDKRPAVSACSSCGGANAAAAEVCVHCGARPAAGTASALRPPGALRYIVIGALVCLVCHNLFDVIRLLRSGMVLAARPELEDILHLAIWDLGLGSVVGYAIFRLGTTIGRGVLVGGLVGIVAAIFTWTVYGNFQSLFSLLAGRQSTLIPGWLIATLVVYEIHADDAGRAAMRANALKHAGVSLFGVVGLVLGYLASGTILHSEWYFFFYTPRYSAFELLLRLLCLAFGIATVVMSCRRVTPKVHVIGILIGISCIAWEVTLVPLLIILQLLVGSY